jgi:hypothetical protein
MKSTIGFLAFGFGLALSIAACAGKSTSDDAAGADEQDIKAALCGPLLTITCAPGFEPSEQGCAQSHVAGAQPQGRCVSVDVKNLLGTFTNPPNTDNSLRFFSYSFSEDGSFKAIGGCRPNPNGPSCFAVTGASGTWLIQKSGPQLGAPGGVSQLVTVDTFNQKDVFFYKIDGNKLELSTTFGGKVSEFDKQ